MGHRQFLLVRVGSLPLRAHWSWPLVLVLLCVGLAPLYGLPLRPESLALSVFSVVLLYASVLIHELAHAAAALRAGLPVKAVVLFAFGGWTEIDERRLRPSDELLIAAAGPLASLRQDPARSLADYQRHYGQEAWRAALAGVEDCVNRQVDWSLLSDFGYAPI